MEQNLTFADLGLSAEVLQALEQKGYGYPTKIQAEAIPPFMEWKDVIAKAPTGTGKTFAFGIPMIEHIDADSEDLQGLILAPTRELAIQIGDELRGLVYGFRLAGYLRHGVRDDLCVSLYDIRHFLILSQCVSRKMHGRKTA